MTKNNWIAAFALAVLCHPFAAHATNVQEIVTPGGITAWLVEEHALPLIAVNIAFRDSGTAYDAPGKSGRASMTAALLMEGAGDMRSQAFNEALEDHAIRLNMSVEEEVFRASLETLSEQKEQAFTYLGLALTKPRFDSDATERVRSQSISMLTEQERDPGYLLRRSLQTEAYPNHPYANPLLGTPDAIAHLQPDDFRDFARRYLTRSNMLVAVVGDITPKELSRLLDANLAGLPAHYDADVTIPATTMHIASKPVITDLPIPQTLVAFGTNGVKRDDPEYYTAYVMNQLLGGGGSLNTRLAIEVREKRGLAYSIYTQLKPMDHTAAWLGSFSTRNEKVGEAMETLHATLKNFVDKGAGEKELADAKQYLTGSFVLNLDSNAQIADYLTSMQLYHLGRDYLNHRNQFIEAVTKKQVDAMSKKLIDPDKLLVVMVGKPNLAVKP